MPLEQFTIRGRAVLLHPECHDGFKSDREHGAIYGPYRVIDPISKKMRWAMDAEEASLLAKFCPYCGRH